MVKTGSARAKRGLKVRQRRAKAVPLATKVEPSQERARNTFETILDTTAQILTELGFERLSTNLVCERAGLTPPALYRYFPNKYAILKELGRRLMELQDDAVYRWIGEGGLETETLEDSIASTRTVQLRVNEITRQQPGGVWIMRALRAVPLLREVRTASRDKVAERVFKALRKRYPNTSAADLRIATRLTNELMYAATEMVLEEPDRDADKMTAELSRMIALYFAELH